MKFASLLPAAISMASIFTVLSLHSCQEEEVVNPPFRQDLADIETTSVGANATLTRDDGTALTIDNSSVLGKLSPNVIYRALAVYVETDKSAHIYGCTKVLSPQPEEFKESSMRRDPVKKVLAAWRGGRYINLHLTVATTNHSQHFAFADKGLKQNHDGSLTWQIELYHNQNKDGYYYSREVYISCPINGKEELQSGRDSVAMTINTYGGTITKRLRY